ncbi:unnamed protein product [Rhodiola kirilowii]
METTRICQLLNQTLSSDGDAILSATAALDELSLQLEFPYLLLSIAIGDANLGLRMAAATYTKNYIFRNADESNPSGKMTSDYKERLVQTLLQAEPAVAKVLAEPFRHFVIAEFVKENMWPELVPSLHTVISNSNLIGENSNCQWKTVNALIALQAVVRPFQYFFSPKVAKEPVPSQLELIATEILKPMLAVFHRFVDKVTSTHAEMDPEVEEVLHIICKCIFFAVKSHMPSALPPLLPSICHDLCKIISSLKLSGTISEEDGYFLRLKTGKRSFLVLSVLITRHRKYSDRLLPDIVSCALNTAKCIENINKLDFLSERIASLALDVISNALEHGPGWRLISPHFSSLLESVVFPALILNEKDISEWEEDPDEYLRKNLPSNLEEASESKESLFTARKSAINLLGVISKLKGPQDASSIKTSTASKRKKGDKKRGKDQSVGELLVLPFLSKFSIPSDAATSQTKINNYYGVLMAYGGLQDFLKEQKHEYTANLIRSRVLPLYTVSCAPYLIGSANWVLGELASCLPQDMNGDIYSSLLKVLVMPKYDDVSSYPVCVSVAGAITNLLESDYLPPEWLPVVQVVLNGFGQVDEIDCILFKLLSTIVEAGNENVAGHVTYVVSSLTGVITKYIPPFSQSWPQTADRGFEALAALAKVWEDSLPEEDEEGQMHENWKTGRDTIARAFSFLLQKAWLMPSASDSMEDDVLVPSCMDDLSVLLLSIIRSITDKSAIQELKISELLVVWANLIAAWHCWDDLEEDLSTFICIKEVASLHEAMELNNFLEGKMPPPPAPPVPQRSIIEGVSVFLSETISQFPIATWKACSCVHTLLNTPIYLPETTGVKRSLAISFCKAAFSRFIEFQSEPCSMWKPLLLAVASCYMCYPDDIEVVLDKEAEGGFTLWVSAMIKISKKSFEFVLTSESEIKLAVLALATIFEQLLAKGISKNALVSESFAALMEASVWHKEVREEEEELDGDDDSEDEDAEDETDADDDYETEDDEDSECNEPEETDEQFLARYAETAAEMEKNGTAVEEDDLTDQDADLDLGCLEAVDQLDVVGSLVELHRQSIMQIEGLPSPLVSKFLDTFPHYRNFFLHR